MGINERMVSEAILDRWTEKFKNCLDLDVTVVGGGPSGLMASWKLAERGLKVALFERKLSTGGGMWGGGMTYNFIVIQAAARRILDELGVPCREYGQGYFTADAVTATTTLASRACLAGVQVFNCLSVEDVVLSEDGGNKRLAGPVVNSPPVEMTGLHVDPLVLHRRAVIESTGHAVELLKTLVRKNGVRLNTKERRHRGRAVPVGREGRDRHPREHPGIFPGLWVAGIAANASFGSYRMGPIFGNMLLSGEKVAALIGERLKPGY